MRRFNRRKKGIELSINFVVMLVLAIAVFSLGLVFISKLFTKAEDIKLRLDTQSESELKSILNGGSQVAIYPSRVEVKKNQNKVIGIGVMNSLRDSNSTNKFLANVSFVKAIELDNSPLCEQGSETTCFDDLVGDVDTWLMTDINNDHTYTNGVITMIDVKKNTQEEFLVAVSVPNNVLTGTFVFSVEIFYWDAGWVSFSNPDRFYIIIK